MDNFDSYLRNIDINVIKSRIENEWDIIQDIPYQGQTIDGQELLSSFIDIMKLYLIGNGELSLPENPDSLVNFFLSYVYLKFECVNQGTELAWKMIKQLEEKSKGSYELRIILFLLEQDNKKSFCEFYLRARNIMIEFLRGFESDFIALDQLSMAIDQWSEISRRLFETNQDAIIKKIAKVITCDQHEEQTFDPTYRTSCGRLLQICLWIYFKTICQSVEDERKFAKQSGMRKEQREENKIPTSFYKWGNPLFKETHFESNKKYMEFLKMSRLYKQQFPTQSTNKAFNSAPPKPKTFMPHLQNSANQQSSQSPSPPCVNSSSFNGARLSSIQVSQFITDGQVLNLKNSITLKKDDSHPSKTIIKSGQSEMLSTSNGKQQTPLKKQAPIFGTKADSAGKNEVQSNNHQLLGKNSNKKETQNTNLSGSKNTIQ